MVKGQSYEERAEAFVKLEDAILGIGRIQRVAELAGEVSVPDSTLEDPGKEVVPYTGVGPSDVSLLPVGTSQYTIVQQHHQPVTTAGRRSFYLSVNNFKELRSRYGKGLCRQITCAATVSAGSIGARAVHSRCAA